MAADRHAGSRPGGAGLDDGRRGGSRTATATAGTRTQSPVVVGHLRPARRPRGVSGLGTPRPVKTRRHVGFVMTTGLSRDQGRGPADLRQHPPVPAVCPARRRRRDPGDAARSVPRVGRSAAAGVRPRRRMPAATRCCSRRSAGRTNRTRCPGCVESAWAWSSPGLFAMQVRQSPRPPPYERPLGRFIPMCCTCQRAPPSSRVLPCGASISAAATAKAATMTGSTGSKAVAPGMSAAPWNSSAVMYAS